MLHGISEQELIGDGASFFLDNGRDQPFTIADMDGGQGKIVIPTRDALVGVLKDRRLDVLMIDPFVSCHRLPENDNGAMDMIIKEFMRIADATNIGGDLYFHTRKLGELEATSESLRGGRSQIDGLRAVRVLNTMTETEGAKAGIEGRSCRSYFRAYIDKLNHAPPAKDSDWFKIESVALGNGDGWGTGAIVPWQWPDALAGVTAAHLLAVQRAIAGKRHRYDFRAADWVGHAVAKVLGLDAARPADRAKIKTCVDTWIRSGALTKENWTDDKGKVRPVVEVGEYADE